MINKLMLVSVRGLVVSTIAFGGAALAADLPSTQPPPVYIPLPPVFTWTGHYIGGQAGYTWGTSATTATNSATGDVVGLPNYDADGFVGGLHHGYNYQISQFVIGYEHSIDGSTYAGSGLNNSGTISHTTNMPFETSLRGRVSIAWERSLIYATGGLALGRIENASENTMTGAVDSFDAVHLGWTVGGGLEYAVTDNWSVNVEYRYTDFGNISEFEGNSTGGLYTVSKHETDNKVQVGFSYKFNKPLLQLLSNN
jgi:outer membrane immunogenic protein